MKSISAALFLVVAFTAITSLMIGYDLCIVSSVLNPISSDFNLCGASSKNPNSTNLGCFQKALFVSTLSPGAAMGSIIAGIFSDIFGRRRGLMLGDILISVGSVCFAFGQTYAILLIGRFIIGIGIGVGFVVFAIYIPEVAPARERGGLVAAQDCALSVGCLLSYAVIALVSPTHWRILLGSVGIAAALQFIGCFFLPESPRWLLRRERSDDAVASVLRLLPRSVSITSTDAFESNDSKTKNRIMRETAENVVRSMAKEFYEEKQLRLESATADCADEDQKFSTWTKRVRSQLLFTLTHCWKYRARVAIAIGCAVAQNFTVSNSVLYFSLDIFHEAGVTNDLLAGVGVGLVKFLGVLSAILLVDRIGRRLLLLWGSIATCLCLFAFSAFFAGKAWANLDSSWISIPIMLIYIFSWNISWAGLMFVVASEVLPSVVRGVGMGATITVFWLMSFLFQSALEPMMVALTMQGAFFFFGCLNILSILFVVFCVRDLTGVPLEDVAAALKQSTPEKNYTPGD